MHCRPALTHLSQLPSGLSSLRLHLSLDSLQVTHALSRLALLGADIECEELVNIA
jgi:hypothetical protein